WFPQLLQRFYKLCSYWNAVLRQIDLRICLLNQIRESHPTKHIGYHKAHLRFQPCLCRGWLVPILPILQLSKIRATYFLLPKESEGNPKSDVERFYEIRLRRLNFSGLSFFCMYNISVMYFLSV